MEIEFKLVDKEEIIIMGVGGKKKKYILYTIIWYTFIYPILLILVGIYTIIWFFTLNIYDNMFRD